MITWRSGFVLLLLLFCGALNAQQSFQNKIDSLNNALQQSTDTARVLVLIQLARQYMGIENNKTLDLLNQAQALTGKLNFVDGSLKLYTTKAALYTFYLNDFETAKQYVDSILLSIDFVSDTNVRINGYYTVGAYFTRAGDLLESYHWLLKGQRELSGNITREVLGVYGLLGYNTKLLGRYEEAKTFFRMAHEYAVRIHEVHYGGSMLFNLATVYQTQQQYDSALVYLRQVYTFEVEHGSPNHNVLLLSTLGTTFLKLNERDSSIHYLHRALKAARGLSLREGLDEVYLALAEHHLGTRTDSTLYYIRKIRDNNVGKDIHLLTKVAQLQYETFAKLNRFDSAFYYLKQHKTYSDSVQSESKARQIALLEYEFDLEKKEKQIEDLKQAEQWHHTRRTLLTIALVLALLLLIGSVFYSYRIIRDKQKRLESANRQLNDYLERLLEKSELVEELNIQLEKLRQNNFSGTEQFEDLEKIVNLTILTDEDWKEFKTLFERVHKGFIKELVSKFPDLTNAEIRLAALLKLKLSTREIAGILGISPESVSKTRHRLRKKLNLPVEEGLDEFIRQVTEKQVQPPL
ncbi:MAG: tetratricopeptide repeat protein [Cyclobacteriaceae bacterium]|nr:tetratricopeptide repeat protein [Cyclobacteriaceae bacterium]